MATTVLALFFLWAAATSPATAPACPDASSTIHWLNAASGDFRITVGTGSTGGQIKGKSWKGPLRLRLVQRPDCKPALELSVRDGGGWRIVADQVIRNGSRIETPTSSYFDAVPILEVETIE